jgi:hypothetical protein
MKISKKLKKKVLIAIDDFFLNEVKDLLESEYPPYMWSIEDQSKLGAFMSSSIALTDKITKILETD